MKIAFIIAVLALSTPALAEMVNVEITGSVESEQVDVGEFANVHPGDAIVLSFAVDSENAVNGAYPTRAYAIDPASFSLVVGSVTVALQSPFPAGQTPYFVLRDNDPEIDGFFVSLGPDVPFALPLDEPANVEDYYGLAFYVGYNGDILNSLDILDANGSYSHDGLTEFHFSVVDGRFEAISFFFEQLNLTTSVDSEAASMSGVKALFQ